MKQTVRFLTIIYFLSLFLINQAYADKSDRVDQAVDTLRKLCLAGENLEIQVKSNGSLSLLKKGVKGAIIFSKTNKNGIVEGLQGELLAKELENIRDCMEPRIDKILDLILENEQKSNVVHDTITKIPLPQLWEGDYQDGSRSHPMRLFIEKIDGTIVLGKLNFPDRYNIVYKAEGEFVNDFGDFTEESKWRLVKSKADLSKDLLWIKFRNTAIIQSGGGASYNYVYYAYITKTGIMRGNFFPIKSSNPDGGFTLFLQP